MGGVVSELGRPKGCFFTDLRGRLAQLLQSAAPDFVGTKVEEWRCTMFTYSGANRGTDTILGVQETWTDVSISIILLTGATQVLVGLGNLSIPRRMQQKQKL